LSNLDQNLVSPIAPIYYYAIKNITKNLPRPRNTSFFEIHSVVIVIRVKDINDQYFRTVYLNDFTLNHLKDTISQTFGKRNKEIISIVLLPETQLWRDDDLLSLKQFDSLVVIFEATVQPLSIE
jgi:hypothetical protein